MFPPNSSLSVRPWRNLWCMRDGSQCELDCGMDDSLETHVARRAARTPRRARRVGRARLDVAPARRGRTRAGTRSHASRASITPRARTSARAVALVRACRRRARPRGGDCARRERRAHARPSGGRSAGAFSAGGVRARRAGGHRAHARRSDRDGAHARDARRRCARARRARSGRRRSACDPASAARRHARRRGRRMRSARASSGWTIRRTRAPITCAIACATICFPRSCARARRFPSELLSLGARAAQLRAEVERFRRSRARASSSATVNSGCSRNGCSAMMPKRLRCCGRPSPHARARRSTEGEPTG